MPPRIIGLSGFARAGKDTVGRILVEHAGFGQVAFADPLRALLLAIDPIVDIEDHGDVPELRLAELVELVGWEVAKDTYPEVRRLMDKLGTEGGRHILGENVWVDAGLRTAEQLLADGAAGVVFTDVRFPNEVEAIVRQGGWIVYVERPGYGPVTGHASERLALEYAGRTGRFPDVRIVNDGTIEELTAKVQVALG